MAERGRRGARDAVRGSGAVAPRKRGPPKREIQYTRALYRFRTDQLEKLRTAAGQRVAHGGAYDISLILRALVDEWIEKGCPIPKGIDGDAR